MTFWMLAPERPAWSLSPWSPSSWSHHLHMVGVPSPSAGDGLHLERREGLGVQVRQWATYVTTGGWGHYKEL